MLAKDIVVGRDYAWRESSTIHYLVLDKLRYVIVALPAERVRLISHVRSRKYTAEWMDTPTRRVETVHASDLACPWANLATFLDQERDKALQEWIYIDELAKTDHYLAAEQKSIQHQWSGIRDDYSLGYYYAGRDLLRRFGFTRTDSQGRPKQESWIGATLFAFLSVVGIVFLLYRDLRHPPSQSEVRWDMTGKAVDALFVVITASFTRRWIRAYTGHRSPFEIVFGRPWDSATAILSAYAAVSIYGPLLPVLGGKLTSLVFGFNPHWRLQPLIVSALVSVVMFSILTASDRGNLQIDRTLVVVWFVFSLIVGPMIGLGLRTSLAMDAYGVIALCLFLYVFSFSYFTASVVRTIGWLLIWSVLALFFTFSAYKLVLYP